MPVVVAVVYSSGLLEKQTGESRDAYALMSGAGVLQYVLPCTRLECLSPYAHGAGLSGR